MVGSRMSEGRKRRAIDAVDGELGELAARRRLHKKKAREERRVEGDENGEDAVLDSLADTCAHGRGFQVELGSEDADERDDRDL
jgi:hypothetical protein